MISDDDWDDDPRPVRRRRRKPAGPSPAVLVGAGAVMLVGVLAAGVLIYAVSSFTAETAPAPLPVAKAPPLPPPKVTNRPTEVSPPPMTPIPPAAVTVPPATTPPTASPRPTAPTKGWPPVWSDRPLNQLIVGDWEVDLQAIPSFKREQYATARLEFGADGKFRGVMPAGELVGRWTALGTSGRILHFRLKANDPARQPSAAIRFSVIFTSDDHLEYEALMPLDPTATVRTRLKRVGAVSQAGPEVR